MSGVGGHHPQSTSSRDIPVGLSSSSNLSEEVKMSIRSISSEITIFEIKTPLPDRTVPPCTAGSTTITTIGPAMTGGGGPVVSSSMMSRPPSQSSSLLNLHNKQIQLQPIPNPLSRSQQMAAQNRGLSITASTSTGPVQQVNRRSQQQNVPPSILLNHHKINLTPVTNSSSSSSNSGSSTNINRNLSGNVKSKFAHGVPADHDDQSSNSNDGDMDGRFDPLMMLETQMVEEEREIIPVMEKKASQSSFYPSHQQKLQLQQHMARQNHVMQRFQPLHLRQNTSSSLSTPLFMKPQLQQHSRRKPVLVQLVELPDEDESTNKCNTAISTKSSLTSSAASTREHTVPRGTMSMGQALDASTVGVKVPPRPVPSNPRGRVPTRRKKRKRLYSSARLNQGNQSAGSTCSVNSNSILAKATLVRPPKTPISSTTTGASTSKVNSTSTTSGPSAVGTGPPTSMYRTRTVVKATLAAENQKALEEELKAKKANSPPSPKPKTMKDVLASIPGFGAGRPRKRHNRKLSTAEQLELTKKEGCIDLETPRSILTQVNLRAILNKHTFSLLPSLYQYKLIQLLPDVDAVRGPDSSLRLSGSGLNNEFFAKACQEWREKLTEGEFTPEQRYKNRLDAEREKLKLDPWKVKHFEPIWGDKGGSTNKSAKLEPASTVTSSSRSDTLAPPKPLAYNLRRSPNRSPFTEKSQSLETSPIMSSPTSLKSAIPSLKSIDVNEQLSLIADDEISDEEEDDENDADFELDDESGSDIEGIEEMSSARTTGLVQRSTTSDISQRTRKRSGPVEESDKDLIVKKSKLVPLVLSPVVNKVSGASLSKDVPTIRIQNVQEKVKKDAVDATVPDGSIVVTKVPLIELPKETTIKPPTVIKESAPPIVEEIKAEVVNPPSRPRTEKHEMTTSVPKPEIKIGINDIKVSLASVDSTVTEIESSVALIPVKTPKVEAPKTSKIEQQEQVQTTESVPAVVVKEEKKVQPITISTERKVQPISTPGSPRKVRPAMNVVKKDVAVEVNIPDVKPKEIISEAIPKAVFTSQVQSPSSTVSVPVGTEATLTPIPMTSSSCNKKSEETLPVESQAIQEVSIKKLVDTSDCFIVRVNSSSGKTTGADEVKQCLIPPEIQCILPPTLTVVSSDAPPLLISLQEANSIASSLTSVTSVSSLASETIDLSAKDVTITPNVKFSPPVKIADCSVKPQSQLPFQKQVSQQPSIQRNVPSIPDTVPKLLNVSIGVSSGNIVGSSEKKELKSNIIEDVKMTKQDLCTASTDVTITPTKSDTQNQDINKGYSSITLSSVANVAVDPPKPQLAPVVTSSNVLQLSHTASPVVENIKMTPVSILPSVNSTIIPAVAIVKNVESSITPIVSAADVLSSDTKQKIVEESILTTTSSTTNTSVFVLPTLSPAKIPVSVQQPIVSTQNTIHTTTNPTVKTLPPVPVKSVSFVSQIKPAGSVVSLQTSVQPPKPIISVTSSPIQSDQPAITIIQSSQAVSTTVVTAGQATLASSPAHILPHPAQSSSPNTLVSSSQNTSAIKNQKPRPTNGSKTKQVCDVSTSIFPSLQLPKQASAETSKVPRIGSNPPGQINLERSYQICRAVIQNSPNRAHLQNQLVKPPPVPVQNRAEGSKNIVQQHGQLRTIQGHPVTQIGDAQVIQVQRRCSTPTMLPNIQPSSMPVLSGIGPHQKVILTHIAGPQGSNGQTQISLGHSGNNNVGQSVVQQPGSVMPLIRPVQPGSPIIVRSTSSGNQPIFQQQNQSTTVITPQQLAMLIQQQHQQSHQTASPQQRHQAVPLPFISVNQINRTLSQPSRPNSASSVILTNPNPANVNNPGCGSPTPQNSNPQIKILHPQGQSIHSNTPCSQSGPSPTVRHQVLHIPVQRQQSMNPGSPGLSLNNSQSVGNFPVRAQIVTSNGETLTIHRASGPTNGQVRLANRPSYGLNINLGQMKKMPQNFITISNRAVGPGSDFSQNQQVISNHQNKAFGQMQVLQGHISTISSGGRSSPSTTTANMIFRQAVSGSSHPHTINSGQNNIRLISVNEQNSQKVRGGGRENENNEVTSGTGDIAIDGMGGTVVNSSMSNLAEFISNQLAASNIRPISPLTFDQSGLKQGVGERNSPNVFTIHSQNSDAGRPSSQGQNTGNSSSSSDGVMLVSLLNSGNNNNNNNSNSSNNAASSAVNSNVISSSNQIGKTKFSLNPMADLINCTNEVILDLQDTIAAGVDSPYSLISEPELPSIGEIIDVPTSEAFVVTTSSGTFTLNGTLNNSKVTQGTNWGQNQRSEFISLSNDGNFSGSITTKSSSIPVNTSSSSMSNPNTHIQYFIGSGNANSLSVPTTSANNNFATSNNSSQNQNPNRIDASPVVLRNDGIESNTVLVQGTSSLNSGQQQQTPQNSAGTVSLLQMPSSANTNGSHSQPDTGVRQQQYIIVQTTGSNGLPTNLAVPANLVISPSGQLILNDQNQKGPPRASSAPPVQNGNQIILNPHQHQIHHPGSISGPFGNQGSMVAQQTGGTINVSVSHNSSMATVSQTDSLTLSTNKTMSIPTLEIQEGGGVRVVYAGQNSQGGLHHIMNNNSQIQQVQQRHFTVPHNRGQMFSSTPVSSGQFCVPMGQSNQHQIQQHMQGNSTNSVQIHQQASSFSTQNLNINPISINNGQNIVHVQVSQAPTIVHQQQTINHLVNVSSQNSHNMGNSQNVLAGRNTWNTVPSSSSNQAQLINVNLNGVAPGSTARIITTTGQHPVISIPDTTQTSGNNLEANEGGGNSSGLVLGGQEFDIFKAIEGMNAKVNNGNNASGGNNNSMGNIILETTSRNVSESSGARRTGNIIINTDEGNGASSNNDHNDFHGVVDEVEQIILDSGGNCVCDLRAMCVCRKCGVFCHESCIGPSSDLCVTCLIR